jgi:hypothetical protein
MRRAALMLLLSGCSLPDVLSSPTADCDERTAWWPDDDGDGVGEDDEVLFLCDDPGEGWTTTPPTFEETDQADGATD